MADVSSSLVFYFFIFLFLPFIFGYIFKKLRVSPIIGYIAGGLVLGLFSPYLKDNLAVQNFAYFGIILLLFTIGLEVNFNQLLNFKKIIFIAGSFQLLLSVILIAFISLFFKFNLIQSFLIGIILSSSSTALVAKIIEERGEENTFLGEVALGILMFQNIAFIPYMIILNSITANKVAFLPLFWNIIQALFKSTLIIVVLWYLGSKLTPKIFDRVAKTSRELLNLFIFIFIFFVTYICLILKIPTLVGVFIAGILVGQSLEHYHIFSQVNPLRNILAVIFFAFIGLNISLPQVVNKLLPIFIFTTAVVLIKMLIVLLIFLFMRFHSKQAFSLAAYLFQIDEDAFILSSIIYLHKIINYQEYLFLISSVLISLILTPIIIEKKDILYQKVRNFLKKYLPFIETFIKYRIDRDISPIDYLTIKNHIILCGYGRVGSLIGRALLLANIPFVAVDYNFSTVLKARKEGVNIIYGDPTDIDILDYVQVEEALVLISVVPDLKDQEALILNARKLNKNIFIIARAHSKANKRRLKDLGVNMIIQPEFEASIAIISRVFSHLNLPKEKIIEKLKLLRIQSGF